MDKRGPLIAVFGLVLVLISLSIAVSVVPSNLSGTNDMMAYLLFEEMFDEITTEILIEAGDA